jgi:hypothetical protein
MYADDETPDTATAKLADIPGDLIIEYQADPRGSDEQPFRPEDSPASFRGMSYDLNQSFEFWDRQLAGTEKRAVVAHDLAIPLPVPAKTRTVRTRRTSSSQAAS